jgi:hypothetical protein
MFTGTFKWRPGTKMNIDNRLSADILYRGGSSCGQLNNNIIKLLKDNQLLVKPVHARCREIFRDVISIHYCLHTTMRRGKCKGHPCTGTEALYRPYGPQGEQRYSSTLS